MSGPTSSANSIRAKVQQQLQQSGLLQQLPALLTTAADELDKQINRGSSEQDDSTSSSRSTSAAIAGSATYRGVISLHASNLLETYWQAVMLWQGLQTEKFAIAAASAPAAMRLALAAMHYVDSRVRAVPQTEQKLPADVAALQQLLLCAHACINCLASTMHEAMFPPNVLSESPEVNWKHLFQSPHSLPCLALMVCMVTTSLMSTPDAAPASSVSTTTTTSSSSSTTSGSSSSHFGPQLNQHSMQQHVLAHNPDSSYRAGGAAAGAMQAWQQACAKLPHLTASHHQLFELLGVDSRTVLWTAASLNRSAAFLLTILSGYAVLVQEWGWFYHMWQGVDPQVHLLLSAIVLQCVAGMPADRDPGCCIIAFSVFDNSTAYWKGLMQPSNAAAPAVAEGRANVQSQQQPEMLAQRRARQQEVQEELLPAAFVNEVLPHILTLYSQLQASFPSDAAVGPAASAQRSTALAGEGTSTGSDNQGLTTAYKLAALKSVVFVLDLLFNRLSTTSGTPAGPVPPVTGVETAAAAATQTTESGKHLHAAAAEVEIYLEAFQHHALQIVASVEGVARRMAAAPSPDRDSGILMKISHMCHGEKPGAASRGPLLIMARTAGPGSPEQRQLYSLLSSMLKLRHSSMEGVHSAINHCRMAAAAAVVALLSQQAGGNTAAAVSNTAANAVPADLSDLLPSLFIFGCCCLQWAEQLQQETFSQLLQLRAASGQQAASGATSRTFMDVLSGEDAKLDTFSASEICFCLLPFSDERASLLLSWLLALGGWLQSSDTSAQLASVGYDPEQLLQQLHGLASTLHTAVGNTANAAPVLSVVLQLHGLGVALSSVATPHACNNPNCSNVSGPSERQLVSGRGSMCSGCRTARYCSKACQKQHWKQHKPTCKALAAAKAPATTVPAAT